VSLKIGKIRQEMITDLNQTRLILNLLHQRKIKRS
jgi:hypothetical protein